MNNTGNLIAAGQIVDAVQNFFDWQMLYSSSKTFAMFNNLGMVNSDPGIPVGKGTTSAGGKGNYRIAYNKTTGIKTDYTCTGAITPTAGGTLDFKTLNNSSHFDISAPAFTLVNLKPRAGLGIEIIGEVVDSANVTKSVHALFRVNAVTNASTDWTCQLLASSLSGVDFADKCTSIKAGSFCLFTEVAKFDDAAPESDDMTTSQFYNYIQMFDSSYGKDYVAMSQQLKFDYSMGGLRKAVEPAFYSKINAAMWFGLGYAPNATYNYGAMNGIWKQLNLSDPTKNTDEAKPIIKVESGTEFNYDTLFDMFADRTAGAPEKVLGFTTSKFSGMIERAARAAGEQVRTNTVQFPRMSYKKRSIMVGETELVIIIDDKLKYHPALVDQTNSALVAAQEHVLVGLDPRSAGITYHDNEVLGTMIPKVSNLDPVRAKRVEEAHILSALTVGVWNLQNQMAYGITNT